MDIWAAMAACEPPEKDFTLDDLNSWTNNFSPMALIAKGTYGLVFHSVVNNWQEGAVKKLDTSSAQVSDDDFKAQVREFLTLEHENLTKLYGYCLEEENRYLVYEYAALGSLHDVLHGRKGVQGAEAGPVLSWAQRAKIAYGAAKGLEYLHEMVEPPIVHGEVRSSNVLLFYDFEPKIGDFNLPRTMRGEVSQKSDVYSFGVVLLELLTGRKAVDDTLPEEQQDLVTWVTPYLSAEKVELIVDPKLNGDFPEKALAKVAEIAGLCVQDEPDFRPNMSIVVKALESLQAEPEVSNVEEIEDTVKFLSLDDVNNATYSSEPLEEEPEAPNLTINEAPENYEPVQEETEDCNVAKTETAVNSFSMEDLNGATDNYSQMSLVAKGSYSRVFHANFNTGQIAAAKKLDMSSTQDLERDFAAQVSLVSTLEHEHLTKLHGYCCEEDNRVLVYDFATRGSLHDVLHGRKGVYGAEPGHVLTWAQRAKIACEAAKGLEYLHEKVEPRIVHGDVRSSNVLLFDGFEYGDFTTKIADFNLSKAMTGEVTEKADVYSFGGVLLELLTGRKVIDDTKPEEQQDLIEWATPYIHDDNLKQILDPKLNGDFPQRAVAKVAAIAGLCIQDEPAFRPNMSIVVKGLQTLVNA